MGKSYFPQSASLGASPNPAPQSHCSAPLQPYTMGPTKRTTQTAESTIEYSVHLLPSQRGDPGIYLSSCLLSHTVHLLLLLLHKATRLLQQPSKALSLVHIGCLIQNFLSAQHRKHSVKELLLGCKGIGMCFVEISVKEQIIKREPGPGSRSPPCCCGPPCYKGPPCCWT